VPGSTTGKLSTLHGLLVPTTMTSGLMIGTSTDPFDTDNATDLPTLAHDPPRPLARLLTCCGSFTQATSSLASWMLSGCGQPAVSRGQCFHAWSLCNRLVAIFLLIMDPMCRTHTGRRQLGPGVSSKHLLAVRSHKRCFRTAQALGEVGCSVQIPSSRYPPPPRPFLITEYSRLSSHFSTPFPS